MKLATLVVLAALTAPAAPPLAAQDDSLQLEQRNISGPRIGLTYVSGRRADSVLRENGLAPLLSQFGWHFEQIVRPRTGGPMFVIEEVLLVGAVDQGTAIPSASLLMGIRFPSGLEFGMGPNITPTGTALAIGVGKSLRYGAVAIPLNVAWVHSPGANRWSFIFGYAMDSGVRRARR
jgi:hypothetical protein